jgi:hypothetical protein
MPDIGGEAATPQTGTQKFDHKLQPVQLYPPPVSILHSARPSLSIHSLLIAQIHTRQNAAAVLQQPAAGAFTTMCVPPCCSLST